MRKLIINADDLGVSLDVDAQIEACIQKGVVTSSTLMANGPAFYDGVRIARLYPQVSVGVHLNIIQFVPLTNIGVFRKHGVVDEEGNFIMGAFFCVGIDKELAQAVFEEWDAQISKVESAGIIPTHCDSHQHTHTIPALQDALCRVLDKHKIPRVRRVMVPSVKGTLKNKLSNNKNTSIQFGERAYKYMIPQKRNVFYRGIHFIVSLITSKKWNAKMNKRYSMTDGFYAFRSFYNNKNCVSSFKENSIIELMSHPGHFAYRDETNNLMQVQTWLLEGTELVSYRDI